MFKNCRIKNEVNQPLLLYAVYSYSIQILLQKRRSTKYCTEQRFLIREKQLISGTHKITLSAPKKKNKSNHQKLKLEFVHISHGINPQGGWYLPRERKPGEKLHFHEATSFLVFMWLHMSLLDVPLQPPGNFIVLCC